MWQSLLRKWLFAEAARQARQPRDDSQTQSRPQHSPAHVGVVVALRQESDGITDRLAGVIGTQGDGFIAREGGLKGRRVVVLESGVGAKAATRGTLALIAGHKPRWIISAGFAAGLSAELKPGDIVMPDRLIDSSGRDLTIDFHIDSAIRQANPRLHVGRLLTVDRVIASPDEKRALGQRHGAIALDMESLAVAEVCRAEKIRFLAVRVISDAVARQLPPEVENLMRQKTRSGIAGALAGAIFRRPSSVKDLWRLKEEVLIASDRLGQFLAGIIPQLD